jgi:hypothetical protein
MNATQVLEKLQKAISAIENYREAQRQCPKESAAAEEMFLKCYPKREQLIQQIAGRGAPAVEAAQETGQPASVAAVVPVDGVVAEVQRA